MVKIACVSGSRRFVVALCVLAAPLAGRAQAPPGKMVRIGYLSMGSATGTYTAPVEAFRQGLSELGWVEGRNIVIEYRYAEGRLERLPGLAQELVRLGVEVIAASPTPSVMAARDATRTIPIVGMGLTEPVALGIVADLARPGGNITGVTYSVDAEIFGKQLELLKEMVPKAQRVAALANPAGSAAHPLTLAKVEAAARSLALQLRVHEARGPGEFDAAFAAIAKDRPDALLVFGDSMFFLHRERLAGLALENRLPSMSTQSQWVEAGGLIAYGPRLPDLWRRAASYVDKILRGAKPAQLPIEQPTSFDLVVNRKTAKAIGLDLPRSVLLRADRVIE